MKKLKYVKLFENFQLNESILDKIKSAVGLLKTPKEFDTQKIDNLTLTDEQKDVKNEIIMAINYLKEKFKNDYRYPPVDFKAIKLVNNGLVIETEYKEDYKENSLNFMTMEYTDEIVTRFNRHIENYLSKKGLKVDIEVKCERKELFDKIKSNRKFSALHGFQLDGEGAFKDFLKGVGVPTKAERELKLSPAERQKRERDLASLGMTKPGEKKGAETEERKNDNYEAVIKSAKFGELPVITTITITKK
jgi:hypothetical protein